jgi:hypothetical protein
MPQGAPPKRPLSKPTRLSAAHSKNQKQKANTPRARVIKSTHNSVLARQNNMKNKGSGKLTGMLEKKLAERGMLCSVPYAEMPDLRCLGLC